MESVQTIILPVIITLISSGVWTFMIEVIKMRSEKVTTERRMLLGLGHDVLYQRLTHYLERGYIEPSELENVEYVFKPYVGLGGNGTCKLLYDEVCKLPHSPQKVGRPKKEN